MPYDPQRHGPHRVVGPGFHEQVYQIVCSIPAGRVSTYGDIAAVLGLRSAARQVGFALAAIPDSRKEIPWHRVVNSQGALSPRANGGFSQTQKRRLSKEGVRVSPKGRVKDFSGYRLTPAELLGEFEGFPE